MGQLRLLGEPPTSDDHSALANLAFAQAGHTGFVAAAGLAGGQTIIGGIASGEGLLLQSTAHAIRGYVSVLDDLRLLSSVIRDAAGTRRLSLDNASPFITLGDGTTSGSGDTLLLGRLGLGTSQPAIDPNAMINVKGPGGTQSAGVLVQHGLTMSIPASENYGLAGLANLNGSGNLVAGLNFKAYHSGANQTLAALEAIRAGLNFASIFASVITAGAGLRVLRPYAFNSSARRADTQYGIIIEDQFSLLGANVPTTVYGLKIDDTSGGTAQRLLEIGPATPYLRLIGGSAPAVGNTNLYLLEGATLRRVTAKPYSVLNPTDRVAVLV